MWTYEQSSGRLLLDGELIATGYSGHGAGVDNATLENVPDVGPLPRGKYMIGTAIQDPLTGPVSMHLVPDGTNEMFGRGGFLIHGDNSACNHTASEGCIILPREVREQIAGSDDRMLEVVA